MPNIEHITRRASVCSSASLATMTSHGKRRPGRAGFFPVYIPRGGGAREKFNRRNIRSAARSIAPGRGLFVALTPESTGRCASGIFRPGYLLLLLLLNTFVFSSAVDLGFFFCLGSICAISGFSRIHEFCSSIIVNNT